MSRRSGLGRGLAALIPPSEPDPPEDEAHDPAELDNAPDGPGTTEPVGIDGPPDAAGPSVPVAADPPLETAAPSEAPSSPPVTAAPPETGASSVAGAPDEPDTRSTETAQARPAPPTADGTDTTGDAPTPSATLVEISPDRIRANPRQPREVFDDAEIEGLAVSLVDVGMLQPLVVRHLGAGSYELVAGERRLRAAKLAGLDVVPAVVRHTEDADLLKEALVENIHRVQLNPLEEAAAYQQLLDEFGFTQEELASRIGKSRPAISNALRLLALPPGVQRRVAANVLSAGHAKALLALSDPAVQEHFAERVVAEGLSVRAVEELVRLRLLDEPGTTGASPTRSGGGRRIVAPGLIDLQDDLSDALEARVRITMGARKGKLTIEFASVDDLERVVGVIAGGLEAGDGAIAMLSDDL